MKIENIIKAQQPDIHKRLKQQNRKKKSRREGEHISFSDVMELMKHNSYKRHRGAIRQR
ncbi:hypothetical protein phiCTC2B_27 (endogenous virus) [Clostridium phage phiCTC2B]|uniref:hypothetical protein n=1 Tax=Clostridium phage phiCT19406B TaxID=1567010 RepID=UPI0002F207CB|nr:hypothetical protein [Clostridium tetani]YP_009276924.1 hypothetical protein phiCT19406B_27 [Clostridium phage phiCT19406B]YP_009277368.1 hypothetical protein phiCTC2B_27 [Clostridium phage phiCTC2B]AJA42784.1 hypothetical protein phiCT19406B_27 [Clostridium phage phiCT19406B]AJA42980.1 hypothetical protein phiCTC2B_27 [Clostridium phage phiCTC2B]